MSIRTRIGDVHAERNANERGNLVRAGWMAAVLLALLPWSFASANAVHRLCGLNRVNRQIHGRIVDFTHNHGADRRIWSPALQQKRDLYVYLPPGFDPCRQYPLLLWLHGVRPG